MQLALLVMYNASLQERLPRNELKFYTEHHDEYAGLLSSLLPLLFFTSVCLQV